MSTKTEPREGYAQALLELGAKHQDVFVLDGDCAKANYTSRFRDEYPDRFFNIGIAECDIVGTAAGMALLGKVPFANAYANFLTGRGFDQIRVSVAYSHRNVKIIGHNAGTSAAQEGATHLPLEDVGLMRAIPEMTVIVPADAEEMRKAVHAIYELDGPVYLRVGKLAVQDVTSADDPFEIGKANIIKEGSDITLFSMGHMLSEVLQAADALENQDISVEVMNIHTIKPIDTEAIVRSVSKTGAAVTAEEHSILNGLGSAISEVLEEHIPAPLERVGTKDIFGVSGTMDELFDFFGLRAAHIVAAAQRVLARKGN